MSGGADSRVEIGPNELVEALAMALERMAFVLTDVRLDEEEDLGEDRNWVTVHFFRERDGARGRIWLAADDAFACELGASLLALEAADVDLGTVGMPALLELGNVLGGEVVRLLGGAEERFKLGLPEIAAPVDTDEAADLVRSRLRSDEGGHIDALFTFAEPGDESGGAD
jgi:hypothetical protein